MTIDVVSEYMTRREIMVSVAIRISCYSTDTNPKVIIIIIIILYFYIALHHIVNALSAFTIFYTGYTFYKQSHTYTDTYTFTHGSMELTLISFSFFTGLHRGFLVHFSSTRRLYRT